MWRSIYLFIASSLVLVSAQSECPFGTLTVGSNSDGTPICDECIVSEPSCAEWFNCENTHGSRCNLLNCTDYICNSDEVYAHERFCAKAAPSGEYMSCQENDMFNTATNMCEHITYPPDGSACVEPDRHYPTDNGRIKCVRNYSPQMRICPSGFYMHNEGSETVCFFVRPAECASNSTIANTEASPSVTPGPEEPSSTATARPEEPSSTATAKPEEPSSTATARPEEPSSTATARPEEPSSTATARPKEPSSTATARPEEPSSTATSKPEEPTQTARPEEPSSTATARPEEPSSTSTATARPEEPSSTATARPEEPSSTATAMPEEPSSTATAMPEEPSSTATAMPEEPSSTATSKPEEPTQTARPEEPTQTAKPNPCHCHEPSILVQEKHCLWPELIEQNNTEQSRCNSGDSYIASMEMCRHVIQSSTAATSTRMCPDGFEQEQHSDKVICVRYYETLSEPCPHEGTVYIKEENRLGLVAGCYKISDAMCETMSPTPKPDEPSKTSSATPRPEEPSKTSSVTPRPEEPSKTSSVTPRPSGRPSTTSTLTRTPRRSSTPTMTPRREEPSKSASPSGKPLPPRDICAEDPRNPRCVKPESILNQFAIDAVISPLPTPKPPMEPVVSMRPVPTPTPWPVPQEVVAAIRPEDIPPYIPSRVSFTDGDPVQFEEPQKIQEVQASIACTLRMPLEKIRIETITILTLSTGERVDIQIDPSEYLMSSNGTVVCYEVAGSGRILRSRRLQNTDIQVDIDYLIVEPSIEILALNTSEFAQIISSSPAIQSVAQSVGSSGVASEVTVATYSGIQVPQTTASTSASAFKFPTYGIGILGGAGGLVVLAGFIGTLYYFTKKTKKQASPVQTAHPQSQRRVVFVDEISLSNMPRPSMLGRPASTRTQFNPLHASNAV